MWPLFHLVVYGLRPKPLLYFEFKELDFGFRRLKAFSDFDTETKPIYDNQIYEKEKDGKFKKAKIIRFRCNQLQTLEGLGDQLALAVTQYESIQWLDLSGNELASVGNQLTSV